jgi:hypothetical protein
MEAVKVKGLQDGGSENRPQNLQGLEKDIETRYLWKMAYLDVRHIDDYRICLGCLDLQQSVSLGKSGRDYQRKLEKVSESAAREIWDTYGQQAYPPTHPPSFPTLTHVNKSPRIGWIWEPNRCLARNRPETFSELVFWELERETSA